jgi:diguanylate cyclase (GGDEF)-like protein/PAS domain S-box-containing protein
MWQMLRRFWTASIARQLMLGIALVHACLMSIFVFDLVSRQHGFLLGESRKQAISLSEALAANGTSWVLANDLIGMEEVVNSQRNFPDLRYAMFTDLRGRVLAYTVRREVGRYASDPVSLRLLGAAAANQVLIDDTQLIDVAHPILVENRHIGWARVGISRVGIASSLAVVTQEGLVYTLLAIGVGVLFAFFMGNGLTRDIRRLADFAEHIRSGGRARHCGVDRSDELGDLSHDMNRMLDTLVDKERELLQVHKQIRANEERLRYALNGSNDGLWDWDLISDEIYMSPRWKEMLGFDEHELLNHYDTWRQRLHPDDAAPALAKLQAHLADADKPFEILFRLRHKDQSWRWILSRGRALLDADGKPCRMVGTHVDVTEQKRLEQTLSNERERALVTLRSIGDGVITTFADGTIDYLNPVAEALTGWNKEEARHRALEEVFPIVDEMSRKPIANPVQRCLNEQRVIGLGHRTLLINRQGQEVSIEDSAAPIRDASNHISGVVLVFHDATEARRLQRKIEHQAMHDGLTGLCNRTLFDYRLAELTEQALQGVGKHVLLYIDLDQFKVVNDTVGHMAGDELLKQVATLLQRQVRDADVLARLGGDEFGLLLVGCDAGHGQQMAEKLREQLNEFRFTWGNQRFQIGASFGIALIDQSLSDPNALSLADLACYSAKEQGRNRVHVYHPDDKELAQRRSEMHWVARVKSALENDRLVLYAQRILPLTDNTGREDYRETLVRMLDEDGGIVPPGRFIPAAERYNVMSHIDAWVVRTAFAWLRRPENSGVFLSINLSGDGLSDRALLEYIEQALRQDATLGRRICFEITETAAIGNLREALAFMERLKKCQVAFALDDFGSGLSSFSYLKTLPVDYLKIDGSFIRDLLDDPIDAAMVEAISKVSKEMGIKTIAEFVENDAVLERLRALGIDYAQGYGIAQPHPL